jgi:hypothetical protein
MNRRRCLRHLAVCLCGPTVATVIGARGVLAQGRGASGGVTNVIELFTSQGCSSCPAADALFENYAKRNDVLALSYNVDYWDYLGWKDTLGNAKFTKRQRQYAKARGDGQVYTPQMVVNGLTHVVGSNKPAIDAQLTAGAGKGVLSVRVNVVNGGPHVTIDCDGKSSDASSREATLWLVHVTRRVDVPIKRGENSGKSISYFNVVREMSPIGMWTGQPLTVKLERHAIAQTGSDVHAVLLQQGQAGPIIGAALLPGW